MTACDARGRHLMAAIRFQVAGDRNPDAGRVGVVIWALVPDRTQQAAPVESSLMAYMPDLPRTPHVRFGDHGFLACAVAPDGALGAAIDSGGGLLILNLPEGTVRHRLSLPMPELVEEVGRDLVWEEGELVCRGWPSKATSTIRINPQTGVIVERFDHPVIRCGRTVVRVHEDYLAVEPPGTGSTSRRIPTPRIRNRAVWPNDPALSAAEARALPTYPFSVAVGGWRGSPDGRWLAGTTRSQTQVLIDLVAGRLISPKVAP